MSTSESILFLSPLGFRNYIYTNYKGLIKFFQFPTREMSSEKAKLLWLIKLRWIAIFLFFILFGPALFVGVLTRTTAPGYLGILGILMVFNLVSHLSTAESKKISPLVICYQLLFDLVFLTGLLALTKGFENPFVLLFLLNVSLGGLLISGRLGFPFLILTHIFLSVLQIDFLRHQIMISPSLILTFVVYHFLILSFWLIMRSLGYYLEMQSQKQLMSQINLEKQDRLRSLGALAAGFSHEFASPLNVAKIRLERLKRSSDSEDVSEALAAIQTCQKIIQHMNESQIDSRDFKLKTINVSELINDVIESWREDKLNQIVQLELNKDIISSLPPINFAQCLINLLDNAYEAKPNSKIKVNLYLEKNHNYILVSDDGPGFSDSVLRQRGEPFVTTKLNGTGLGLYVSELFAQSLGGFLEVKNLDPGAQVRLSWPNKEGLE